MFGSDQNQVTRSCRVKRFTLKITIGRNIRKTKTMQPVDIECGDRIYSFTFVPIPDKGYVNLYGLDITERKKAEQSLQESKALIDAIVENNRDTGCLGGS